MNCTKQHHSVCKGVVLGHLGTCPSRKERMTMRHQRPDLCLQKVSGKQSGCTGAPGSSDSLLLHDVLCKARMPAITRIMTLLEKGIPSLTFVCHFYWVGEHRNLCHAVSHPIKCLVEWYRLNIASFVHQRDTSHHDSALLSARIRVLPEKNHGRGRC